MSKDRPYEDLRSLGDHLRNRVPPELSAEVAAAASRGRRPRRRRTWAAVAVTAAVLALSNVALALSSDSAIPGDVLYPLDRAYEWIGGRFRPQDLGPERLSEAMRLVESGDTDRALSLVNEILAKGRAANLQASVDRLRGSGNSQGVRDEVRELVAAVAKVHEAALTGNHPALDEALADVKEEAGDVAEIAGGNGSDNPSVTAPGQVDQPTENSPVTAPGQADDPSDETPSNTAPGQGDNPSEDGPSATAPGNSKNADKPETLRGGNRVGQRSSNP